MYTIQWMIGISAGAALLGILLGWLLTRVAYRGKRAVRLQEELDASCKELEDYKQEVYEQFGETARKFKNLNDSYADLHQQLATSASVLCADMDPSTLLPAPNTNDALDVKPDVVDAAPNEIKGDEVNVDKVNVDEVSVDEERVDGVSATDSVSAPAPEAAPSAAEDDARQAKAEPEMSDLETSSNDVPSSEVPNKDQAQ